MVDSVTLNITSLMCIVHWPIYRIPDMQNAVSDSPTSHRFHNEFQSEFQRSEFHRSEFQSEW